MWGKQRFPHLEEAGLPADDCLQGTLQGSVLLQGTALLSRPPWEPRSQQRRKVRRSYAPPAPTGSWQGRVPKQRTCSLRLSLRCRLRRHLRVRHLTTKRLRRLVARLLDAPRTSVTREEDVRGTIILFVTRGCRERKRVVLFSWGRGPKKRVQHFP